VPPIYQREIKTTSARTMSQITKKYPLLSNTNFPPLNYLPWNISDKDYPHSCSSTPSGGLLQRFKVSSVTVQTLGSSCTNRKYGQTDG